ncbi:energy transducer TonB [Carboxylicivirga sp. M1479]|uniref:energy transducer TonB n=1 Tax=Carboxylicivirga sp. M1479 TaxID=2594476 RepID=UPI00117895E4|nr:energy transducer TonB [Carboxylicivirga sp. M1479]TRX71015.1 hypothetical protein FNN09_08365 [Carboxylicivirga sp. M1479]
MKKTMLFTLVCVLNLSYLVGQEDAAFIKARFDGNINKHFATRIKIPIDVTENYIQGNTVISFKLSKDGEISSVVVDENSHVSIAEQALSILKSTEGRWRPTQVNNEPIDFVYKIVINNKVYSGPPPAKSESIVLKEKSEKKIEKEQYEKALRYIDKAIKLDLYKPPYYKIRSQIYTLLNMPNESEKDRLRAMRYEKEIITIVNVSSYKIVTTRRIG